MTLTKEEQKLIKELQTLLAERLEHNRTWSNIKWKTRKTFFEWTWFNHKEYEDPMGRIYYEKKRLAPLNVKRLQEAVTRQKRGLANDQRMAEREELGSDSD